MTLASDEQGFNPEFLRGWICNSLEIGIDSFSAESGVSEDFFFLFISSFCTSFGLFSTQLSLMIEFFLQAVPFLNIYSKRGRVQVFVARSRILRKHKNYLTYLSKRSALIIPSKKLENRFYIFTCYLLKRFESLLEKIKKN